MINNENEYVFRHVDEAAIKKVESDHIVHMRELDKREKLENRSNGYCSRSSSVVRLISPA